MNDLIVNKIMDDQAARNSRKELISGSNELSETSCLSKQFEKIVNHFPNKLAIIGLRSTITYQNLNNKANQLAKYLYQHGILQGEHVAILMDRSIEMLTAVLGILKAGCAYVPLDPAHPANRTEFTLQDCGAKLVLTDKDLPIKEISVCKIININAIDNELSSYESSNVSLNAYLESTAYVIYTSGSTGRPKGTVINQENLNNYLQWASDYYTVNEKSIFDFSSSLAFDFSVTCTLLPLLRGSTVVICHDDVKLNPEHYLAHLKCNLITHAKCTPSYFSKLLLVDKTNLKIDNLKWVILGGEALVKSDVQRWLEVNSQHVIVNEYGPTEATVATVAFKCDTHNINLLERIPIGKEIYNTEIYILNPEGQICTENEIGELCIAGKSVAQGYLRKHELTEEKFILNTFSKKYNCLYKSGDLARLLPDGNIDYIGRVDEQIKINGYRIELEEISSILAEHSKIKQSSVLFINSSQEKSLAIYYVPHDIENTISHTDIFEYLYKRLPYYMIPKYVYKVDEIPLTVNGKVDKDKLAALNKNLNTKRKNSFDSLLERKIAALFSKVLGINSITSLESFFHLGGDSIAATKLAAIIRNKFKKNINITDVFKYPCAKLLALHLQNLSTLDHHSKINRLACTQRFKPHKVSHAQKRLWIMNEFEPNSSLYNIFGAWKLLGDVDSNSLRNAVDQVVSNHESLRTIFIGGELIEPKQVVIESIDIKKIFKFIKLSDSDESELERFIKSEANTPFDLSKGPLIRALLIKNSSNYYFTLGIHHIICDGWSYHLILKEIEHYYESKKILKNDSIQYLDYSKWSNEYIKNPEILCRQTSYWINELSNLPRLTIGEKTPKTDRKYKGERIHFFISKEITSNIKELTKILHCTQFTILLSAYYLLLSRYSQQEDFSVGVLTAGRNNIHIQNTIGFFVNLLPVRIQSHFNDTIENLISEVNEKLSNALNNQDIPFDIIVEKLQTQRVFGENPLCQVLFAYQNYEHNRFSLKDIQCQRVASDNDGLLFGDYGSSKFDLTLLMQENDEQLEGLFEFSSDKFDSIYIRSMITHFKNILTCFTEGLSQKIYAINMLSKEEINKILDVKHDHAINGKECLFHEFEKCAIKLPDRGALAFNGEKLSYSSLLKEVNYLAYRLLDEGINASEPVAVFMERSRGLVISVLAILKIGAVYLPIDPFNNPTKRISGIIKDSECRHILIDNRASQFHDLISEIPSETNIINIDIKLSKIDNKPISKNSKYSTDPAYIIYTSGSTGKPKGVTQTHRTLLNLIAHQTNFEHSEIKKVALFAAVGFDASIHEIFYTFLTGGELHVIPEKTKKSLIDYINYLLKNEITHIFMPTGLFEYFCYECLYMEQNLPNLRSIMVAGEQLKITQTVKAFFNLHKHTRLENLYGPTETHVVTEHILSGNTESWPVLPSIGKAISNTYALVLDKYLNMLPDGVQGELYIGGDNVAIGYLNQQTLTNDRFKEVDFQGKKLRLYKTGDIVIRSYDESFKYIGRNDNQVKIRGFRVELSDIESCLLKYTDIKTCSVILTNNPSPQLLAFYEKNFDMEANPTALKMSLKEHLPEYMIPTHFICLPKLPLTANGKTDLEALRKMNIFSDENETTLPLSKTQFEVMTLWKHMLGNKNFGLNDNFFDCGGNSLFAIQLVNKIRNHFKIQFSVKSLFASSTIEGISSSIDTELLQRGSNKQSSIPTKHILKLNNSSASHNLFMIHPIGGTVFCYNSLAKNMPDLSFYAIQDPSLVLESLIFSSIEEMASAYAGLIRSIQPSGSYWIAGYSMGGLIANEVAGILIKNKMECNVCLIDSWAFDMKNKHHKNIFLTRAQQNYKEVKGNFSVGHEHLFWLKLYLHHVNLLTNYQNRILHCNTTLFKAIDVDDILEPIDDPTNYWISNSPSILKVINVNATHQSILDTNKLKAIKTFLNNEADLTQLKAQSGQNLSEIA